MNSYVKKHRNEIALKGASAETWCFQVHPITCIPFTNDAVIYVIVKSHSLAAGPTVYSPLFIGETDNVWLAFRRCKILQHLEMHGANGIAILWEQNEEQRRTVVSELSDIRSLPDDREATLFHAA